MAYTGPENGWLIFFVNQNSQLPIEIINKTRRGIGENCSQKQVTNCRLQCFKIGEQINVARMKWAWNHDFIREISSGSFRPQFEVLF